MQALNLSLGVSLLLSVLKVSVGACTGALSLLSEALHSLVDVASSVSAIWTKRSSSEHLSHRLEALILAIGALWIFFEIAIGHFTMISPGPGILVSLLSLFLYTFTYIANAEEAFSSKAVHANRIHILSDIVGSLLVLLGLVVSFFTGLAWIDKAIAGLIASGLLVLSLVLATSDGHD